MSLFDADGADKRQKTEHIRHLEPVYKDTHIVPTPPHYVSRVPWKSGNFWVHKFLEPDEHPVLAGQVAVLEDTDPRRCVTRVPFADFCDELVKSYREAVLDGLDCGRDTFVLIMSYPSEKTKLNDIARSSAWWVLSLLSELVKEFRPPPAHISFLKAKGDGDVIIDDAMYSGKSVLGAMADGTRIVVPYSTKSARSKALEAGARGVYSTVNIMEVNECLRDGDPYAATFFDHKLADGISVSDDLADVIRCSGGERCIVPPYNRPAPKKRNITKVVLRLIDITRVDVENAFYVLPADTRRFCRCALPAHVKWSHILIPGAHEPLVKDLPPTVQFVIVRDTPEADTSEQMEILEYVYSEDVAYAFS